MSNISEAVAYANEIGDCAHLQTPAQDDGGLREESTAAMARVHQFASTAKENVRRMIGYPQNLRPPGEYSEIDRGFPVLQNNYGDPYKAHDNNYRLHTHPLEQELIGDVADRAGLPSEQAWGYVETGSTASNFQAVRLGSLVQNDAVVLYSRDAHDSIRKAVEVCKGKRHAASRRSAREIRSTHEGQIDIDQLKEALRANRSRPAIVVATVGSTFKGAVDDVGKIKQLLDETHLRRHYIHVDAAFMGWPYLFSKPPVPWDFTAGADSICISGHKYPGLRETSSIFITRRQFVEAASSNRVVEYVGSRSTTLAGSRDGVAVAKLFVAVTLRDYWSGLVEKGMALAGRLRDGLDRRGIKAYQNLRSLTVYFRRPSPAVTSRWQLSCAGDLAHAIVMPHFDQQLVDEFLRDVQS